MTSNVWPGMQCHDALATIRWLTGTFGFEEVLVVPGGTPDVVVHAEIRWPEGGTVMVHSYDPEGEFGAYDRPGTTAVYVVTTRPDELYARALDAGARVLRDLRDEDHGSRTFTVTDPEGNAWTFGTYAGA